MNKGSNNNFLGVIIGIISGILVIPVSYSFAAIIFRDEAYSDHLSSLSKLVLISSAIHQLCFSYYSSLPFAIGQVQDAGLVFLAAIADSIACNVAKDKIIPTTIVILPISTMILGLMMIVIGKLKIANFIQYLPMPVIGGYLAFIGFFCLQAGLALMANVELRTVADWHRLFNVDSTMLLLPGLILGIIAYILVRNINSPYVLPVYMVVILITFFAILLFTGITIEDTREAGIIGPMTPPIQFWEIYKMVDLEKVEFSILPGQVSRIVGMFLVVSFSSSLDVAAIEMELGLPLDYDREMTTVGLSNLISGLTGGYTGSYIFSQTIFTMRQGVFTRTCGLTVAFLQILFFLLPISITSYLPKAFFGSLLVFIATDLLYEWLVSSRKKMLQAEYFVLVITFVSIQLSGSIEIGMIIGIIAAIFGFVLTYASTSSIFSTSLKSSTVVRTYEERAVIIASKGKIVTINLNGYIFFASAVKILTDVKKHLVLNDTNDEPNGSKSDDDTKPLYRYSMTPSKGVTTNLGSCERIRKYSLVENDDVEIGLSIGLSLADNDDGIKRSESINSLGSYGSIDSCNNNITSKNSYSPVAPRNFNSISLLDMDANEKTEFIKNYRKFKNPSRSSSPNQQQQRKSFNSMNISSPTTNDNYSHITTNSDAELFLTKILATGSDGEPTITQEVSNDRNFTEYVVLDFTGVSGIDATAARSCFRMLSQLLCASGVTVAFTGLKEPIENLLRSHQVIREDDIVIKVLDDALEYFEERLLYKANVNTNFNEFKKDPSYYATAWQTRKRLSRPQSTHNISLVSSMSSRFSDSDLTKEVELVSVLNDDRKKSSLQPKSMHMLRRMIYDYLEVPSHSPLHPFLRSKTLLKYFERKVLSNPNSNLNPNPNRFAKELKNGDVIIEIGDIANSIFIIEAGSVEITRGHDNNCDDEYDESLRRIAKITSGSFFSEENFFLRKRCQYRYICLDDCCLWSLSRESYAEMERNDNKLFIIIQHILLKSLSLAQNKLINE